MDVWTWGGKTGSGEFRFRVTRTEHMGAQAKSLRHCGMLEEGLNTLPVASIR